MLRAHRQAWAWQDEWVGLTMDDIRQLEKETQIILQQKLGREVPEAVCDGGVDEEDQEEDMERDGTLPKESVTAAAGLETNASGEGQRGRGEEAGALLGATGATGDHHPPEHSRRK